MGLQTSLDVLSEIVGQYEAGGRAVRSVETRMDAGDEPALRATVELLVPLRADSGDESRPELTPEAATVTDTGTLQIEFATSGLSPRRSTDAATVSTSTQAVRIDDGHVVATVELTIAPTDEEGRRIATADRNTDASAESSRPLEGSGDESSGDGERATTVQYEEPGTDGDPSDGDELPERIAAARNEDVPPYEDTEYLQALYDSCDTFVEMSRLIEMDVAAETVRRYMIDAGIHVPNSYDTATTDDRSETQQFPAITDDPSESTTPPSTPSPTDDDPAESIPNGPLVTDGIGLPEDTRIEDVIDAVVDSRTLYEVQRRLDIDRERARELLDQLNLLELVVCRINGPSCREITYEEVATRIRQCAPTGA